MTKTYEEIEKMYFSIGEVAEMLNNLSQSTIRFWTVYFDIPVKIGSRGFRRYRTQDIETLKKIHRLLKVERYTLEGAKSKLKNTES